MKNALFSLNVCLITLLSSGCAFAMGRAQNHCTAPELPTRPQFELCIANDVGGAGCYDPRRNPDQYIRPSIHNYVCTPAVEYELQNVWVKDVIDACKGR